MKRFTVFVTLLMLLLPSAYGQFALTPKREYRAVWLTAIENLDWPSKPATSAYGEEQQKAELRTMLDTLQAIGINTVFLQTRLRGDVIYPSLYEPFASVFTGKVGQRPSYNPLQFAIDECHRRGMQCHAWIVALQVKNNQYVDPASEAVVSHLCTMVKEVVHYYDIDGIHLDYIRYPEKTKGRDQWRRDNVTRAMRAVYQTVKSEKPWICVSAAPLGKYRDTRRYSSKGWNAYNTVFQEAQEWMREGIVDALFPMMYYDGQHFYPFVDDWSAHTYGRHFAAGLGIYQLDRGQLNWPLTTIRSQLHYLRCFDADVIDGMCYGNGACGYALFRAGFLMKNTKGVKDELRRFNRYPTLVPALTWSSSQLPVLSNPLRGTVSGDYVRLQWGPTPNVKERNVSTPEQPVLATDEEKVRYNVYRSIGRPVNIDRADQFVTIQLDATSLTLPRPSRSRDTYYAVTAIDRFGNESQPITWCDRAPTPKPTDDHLQPLSPLGNDIVW